MRTPFGVSSCSIFRALSLSLLVAFLLAAVPALAVAGGIALPTGKAYVPNRDSNDVAVIELQSLQVVGRFAAGIAGARAAEVLGGPSRGKGTVQTLYSLAGGHAAPGGEPVLPGPPRRLGLKQSGHPRAGPVAGGHAAPGEGPALLSPPGLPGVHHSGDFRAGPAAGGFLLALTTGELLDRAGAPLEGRGVGGRLRLPPGLPGVGLGGVSLTGGSLSGIRAPLFRSARTTY